MVLLLPFRNMKWYLVLFCQSLKTALKIMDQMRSSHGASEATEAWKETHTSHHMRLLNERCHSLVDFILYLFLYVAYVLAPLVVSSLVFQNLKMIVKNKETVIDQEISK